MASSGGLDHWLDIVIVVIYFILVVTVGLWSVFRPNRGNVKSYFLAGGSMTWIPVGASIFVSNIGSEHFVGLAGAGASSGIVMIIFEWWVIYLILFTGWMFLPVYMSAGVYTLPEYIEKRHGGKRIRSYLGGISLGLWIVTKLTGSMYAGGLFIQLALGWNEYASIAVLLCVAAVYTVLGGLSAVMYTDTFQAMVMTIGAFVVMGLGFGKVGGYNNMQMKYFDAIATVRNENSTCGLPRSDAFSIFRDLETGDVPWLAASLQSFFGCAWYWCFDQINLQRSLSAKNLSHGKGGNLIAGYMKILPLFLMVFPGMISRILYPDEVACVDPVECERICGNSVGCSNIAYPKLVLDLLPIGARGLLLAVMLSAIMSSLTSVFNSASTIFTMDLWRRFRNKAGNRELLIVGRLFVLLMVVIAILWVPVVKSGQGGKLFSYLLAVEGYIGSPMGVLFVLSIFWKRLTEPAAFWSLCFAHVFGIARLILDVVYPTPNCDEEDTRPAIVSKLHFMYFSQILMLATTIAMIIISFFTKRRSDEELQNVTWWTRIKVGRKESYTNETKMPPGHDSEALQEDSVGKIDQTIKQENDSLTLKTVLAKLCGIPDASTKDTVQVIDIKQRKIFLKESPFWRIVLDVNAVILTVVVAFITAYYH